jgi:hypothetical protein
MPNHAACISTTVFSTDLSIIFAKVAAPKSIRGITSPNLDGIDNRYDLRASQTITGHLALGAPWDRLAARTGVLGTAGANAAEPPRPLLLFSVVVGPWQRFRH